METHPTKAWDWELNRDDAWHVPSPESIYLLDRWQRQKKRKVLDLGCGLGRHSLALARNGFAVSAVDLSEYSVHWVREAAKKENLSIDAKRCNMLKLPFENETFDAILAYNVIYHTDTAGFVQTLAEIRRVLKSGGECFLTLISKRTWGFAQDDDRVLLDANTILHRHQKTEKDAPHFHVNLSDIRRHCRNFECLMAPRECLDYETCGENFSAHWHLLLGKPHAAQGGQKDA